MITTLWQSETGQEGGGQQKEGKKQPVWSSPLVVELQRVVSIQRGGQLPDHLQGLLTLIQAQHADVGDQPGHGTHCHAAHLALDVVCDFLEPRADMDECGHVQVHRLHPSISS